MIALTRVNKEYAGAAGTFRVLRDVDLEIAAGSVTAVVGRSGSGKSTLLNLIAGLDCATSGSIRVGSAQVDGMTEEQLSVWRRNRVGFVFQFFQLLPTLTALENVLLPMDFAAALPARRRHERALDLLGRMGVADQAEKLPSLLSGGQQQRVAIARALANDPEVVLADEPTGNLDSENARAVLSLLRGQGKTLILATHDRTVTADRTVELLDGRIIQ